MVTESSPSARWTGLLVALGAAALLISACSGGSAEPAASGSVDASQEVAEAGRQVLMDAEGLTVLDQPVAYPKKKPAEVSSAVVTLEPGQETGWHKHKTPLFVYVLEGTVTVEYEAGVTKEFPAGTAYLEAEDVFHNGTNMADETVRMLEVSMGAKGAKNTVERAP
jgi:quercetin dioxygenase-like cupin family protein